MGLAISVGNPYLGDEEGEAHFARAMDELRTALAGKGIDWSEPDTAPPRGAMRRHLASFPYRFLHHLRRAYALYHSNRPVTPAASFDDVQAADPLIEDATLDMSSHLLCHADQSGYYVPARFDDPLFLDEAIAGAGMVGSSHGLLRELRGVATHIGVALDDDRTLSDDEATRLYTVDEGDPFGIEQTVWLTLHEACRVSIAHGNAIVFH